MSPATASAEPVEGPEQPECEVTHKQQRTPLIGPKIEPHQRLDPRVQADDGKRHQEPRAFAEQAEEREELDSEAARQNDAWQRRMIEQELCQIPPAFEHARGQIVVITLGVSFRNFDGKIWALLQPFPARVS